MKLLLQTASAAVFMDASMFDGVMVTRRLDLPQFLSISFNYGILCNLVSTLLCRQKTLVLLGVRISQSVPPGPAISLSTQQPR